MKTTGSRASAVSQTRGFGDLLYDKAGARPSLDLDFAGTSSLRDKITGEALVDHTRASGGTYIDSEGLVKLAKFNHVKYSESLENWGQRGTTTTVTANFAIAPDGSQTATRLQMPNAGGSFLRTNSDGYITGKTYTASFYGKSNGESQIVFIGSTYTLNDTWQRFTETFTATSTTKLITFDNNNFAVDALIWGVQVEEGSVATDYLKTGTTASGAPRFTHERVETGNLFKDTRFSPTYLTKVDVNEYTAIAPDGTYSASEIIINDAGSHFKFANPDTTHIVTKPNTPYTVSAYFKAGTHDVASIFLTQSGNLGATFNLNNGTAQAVGGQNTARITDASNGWFRCEVTNDGANTVQSQVRFGVHNGAIASNTIAVGKSVYIWGIQMEEGETASTFVPSIDTFTSRASNATYVDSAGLIKTSYVNKIPNSKDLTASTWTHENVSITANAITAPDGTLTATLLKDSSTQHKNRTIKYNVAEQADNGISTVSIYAKAAGHDYVTIRIYKDSSNHLTYLFYLTGNGSVVNTVVDGTLISNYSPNIEHVGDGWYRLSATFTISQAFRVLYDISKTEVVTIDVYGRPVYGGDTSKGVYLWGAQRVSSSQPEPLVETGATASGGPRYSHDPETLTPTGLYLEPEATNLIKHNTDPSQSVWVRSSTPVLSETTTAPDGSSVPWLNMTNYIYQDTATQSNGTSIASSIWVKAETPCAIGFSNPAGNVVTEDQHSSSSVWGSNRQRRIYLTTEWQRFEISGTVDSGSSGTIGRLLLDNRRATTASTVKIAIWGGQLELNTHATSTIITGSSTVTRAADVYTSTPNLTETFEPRGLLIEEARTTVATYSNIVGKYADWSKGGSTVSTPSSPTYTTPMGTTSDIRELSENSSYGQHYMIHDSILLGTAAKCVTVFVKSLRTDRNVQVRVNAIGGNSAWANFDLDNGIVANQSAASGTSNNNIAWSMGTPFIEKHANGWYRIGLTNCAVASSWKFGLYIVGKSATGDGHQFTGDGGVGFAFWGVSYENGAFPTSYIHNETGSSLIRSADVASISGDNFGTYRTNLLTKQFTYQDWVAAPGSSSGTINITGERALAPDGTFSAFRVDLSIGNGGTSNDRALLKIPEVASLDSNTNYTSSVYLKTADGSTKVVSLGTIHGSSTSITVTGEWQRFQNTSTHGSVLSNQNLNFRLRGNESTATSASLFVWGAQVEAASSATNHIPNTPTFTSRLGNATYVDSNGLIKTSYRNYVKNTDWDSSWAVAGMSLGVQPVLNPFGTTEYVRETNQNAAGQAVVYQNTNNLVSGTISIYAKAATIDKVSLVAQLTNSATSKAASFDLSNGTIQATHNNATASIEDVGNGWYRCSVVSPTVVNYLLINPHDQASPSFSASGRVNNSSGSGGILLFGPQLVDSTTEAGEFTHNFSTTQSAPPRYSHDPETLVPTGLYLEDAGINIAMATNDFTNTTGFSNNRLPATIDPAGYISPTGEESTGIGLLTEDTGNGTHYFQSRAQMDQMNVPYSMSVWIKPLTTDRDIQVRLNGIGNNTARVRFDLQNGTVKFNYGNSGTTASNRTWTMSDPTIEKYPNGWYRIQLHNYVITGGLSGSHARFVLYSFRSNASNNESDTFTGSGEGKFLIWGIQVEENSTHVTSYIRNPTTSQLTRPADTYTSTATTVFDRDGGNKQAFFAPTSGNSLFVGGTANLAASPYPRIFSMSKTGDTSFESWNMYFVAAGSNFGVLRTQVKSAANTGGSMADSSTSNKYLVNDSIYKGAAYIDQGSGKVALNGILGSEDTSVALFNPPSDGYLPDQILFGNRTAGSREYVGTIDRLTFWKTRLPDASLVNITNT